MNVEDTHIALVVSDPSLVAEITAIYEHAGLRNIHNFEKHDLALSTIPNVSPDLILVDMALDGGGSYEFLAEIQPFIYSQLYLPIIAIVDEGSRSNLEDAFELGARDIIEKPLYESDLLNRSRNLLETKFLHYSLQKANNYLEQKVKERTAELEATRLEVINRLAIATNFRDDITGNHVLRVGRICHHLAEALGVGTEKAEEIGIAARLHDIGKIAVPDSILQKPGKLTEDEFSLIQSHATLGASMLSNASSTLVQIAEEIALSHHERWDGAGYPNGLAGENIPLSARICSVADVFDSLTSERQYKRPWTVEDALREIERNSGTQFDPEVVKAFCLLFHQEDDPFQLAA